MAYEIPISQNASNMLILSVTNVNGKTVAATSLGTIPVGQNFIPVFWSFAPTSIVGTGTAPTISLGTNSPTYSDFVAPTIYTTTVTQFSSGTFASTARPIVTSSNPLFVNVSIASTYTTYVFSYSLLGFFQ